MDRSVCNSLIFPLLLSFVSGYTNSRLFPYIHI
jgi:hypothetical protein